jgi:carbonic anhydrase
MNAHTKESRAPLSPADALRILLDGNERFQRNHKANRDLLRQVEQTSVGQFPLAVVLSCMDSRTGAELIFDQGLGDIFSIRIAGNIVSQDILGSIEYAVAVAGAKLVLVLGHTRCGAIAGACSDVQLGNLTGMLEKIKPAIHRAAPLNGDRQAWLDRVAATNVCASIDAIIEGSPDVKRLMDAGEVGLAGAIYDVRSGAVEIMNACEYVRKAAPAAGPLQQDR